VFGGDGPGDVDELLRIVGLGHPVQVMAPLGRLDDHGRLDLEAVQRKRVGVGVRGPLVGDVVALAAAPGAEQGRDGVDVLVAASQAEGNEVIALRRPREEGGLRRSRLFVRVVYAAREQRDRDEAQILSVVIDLRKEGVEEDEAHPRPSLSRATFRTQNGRDPGRPRPS